MDEQELTPYFEYKYITKQQFIYRQTKSANLQTQWETIIRERQKRAVFTPLKDQSGNPIWFVPTPEIVRQIRLLEQMLTLDIHSIIGRMTDWDEKAGELLIDEAFHSSVIEGAVSTRKRTSEMIRKNLPPADNSERMILNNYRTMLFLLEHLDDPISEDAIIVLHHMITDGTLDNEDRTDRYRNDDVAIKDLSINKDIYVAPVAGKVPAMMGDLVRFIGQDSPDTHPIIKACVVHFYFAYVHPFFDGNGRTARVLTIWYLLKQGYLFFKYLSISTAIRANKGSYYRAFEDCENNPTDATYFISNQVKLLHNRGNELLKELQIQISTSLLDDWLAMKGVVLSKRQMKEIASLVKRDSNVVTIEDYRRRHKVVYETARTDLAQLHGLEILQKMKTSRKFVYTFDFQAFCKRMIADIGTN